MARHLTLGRRFGALVVLVVLAVPVASCGVRASKVAGGASGPATTAAPGRDQGEGLGWKDCGGDFECGTLDVPRDWFAHDGHHLSLALIRRVATGPGDRIGSLLVNPGGPGEPGRDFLRSWADSDTVRRLNRRFDLVSWDPRGTGASEGIRCIPTRLLTRPQPDPTPDDQAEVAALRAESDEETSACLRKDGDVIPYVGTRQTARDLDAIRAALGDEGLTYVGFSYGTAIGLEYLRAFPHKVRAMVLDGIVLPGGDPVAMAHDQIRSFEDNLDAFLADCAARATCTFGKPDPRRALAALLARMEAGERLPADYTTDDDDGHAHARNGTLGIGEVYTGIITPLYSRDGWSLLEEGLTDATSARDPNGYLLLSLRDQLLGRNADGTWNHSTEANAAIGCADQPERATSVVGDPALRARWAAEMPFLGAVQAVGQPGCFGWPKALYPLKALTSADLADAPGIALVNSTRDPATPYAGALRAAALLPSSTLVTWDGADHTSFSQGHDCVDGPLGTYLVEGRLPRQGLRCAP